MPLRADEAIPFTNTMPRYEMLSGEAVETIERGWQRLVAEVGIAFDHPEALRRFRDAGQRVEDDVVFLDPAFVLEQVALAPHRFRLHGRDPARAVDIGGDEMVFVAVEGPPFVREGDERREGTLADLERFVALGHVHHEIDVPGSLVCEANDRPLDSRHLDMVRAALVGSDKPLVGASISRVAAEDSLELAALVAGGRGALERSPSVLANVNVNSPLRYDERMLDALLVYAAAGQPLLVTPFLLMGAMAPVTVAAALVQQLAEALAGVALTQLVRPGTPVVLGSFLSHTDMRTGAPGFGGPEAALGLVASGQLARRYGLPWRSGGGGLTTSQTVDAQAAWEALNTLLPAFLAGANVVVHAAGWLESGLVACYEKYLVDVELLGILRAQFTPFAFDEAALAFDAHVEVGHSGHFLGAAHTLARYRDCFRLPVLSSTDSFERWTRLGAPDTAARAAASWRAALDPYAAPPLDDGVHAALDEHVVRRRRELGD